MLVEQVEQDYQGPTVWIGKNGSVECPRCKQVHHNISVQSAQGELVALAGAADGHGKEFIAAGESALPRAEAVRQAEENLIRELSVELPRTVLPKWSGIVNPALYGIETHSDFVNPRQRVVLLALIKALRDEYHRLKTIHPRPVADCVVGMLSSLIDQSVDWNCRLSMWIAENEQVGRAFCGPGVPMIWDYAETDPVLFGPGNLWGKLDRIVEGARSIGCFPNKAHVMHALAQELPFENAFFDAIVADPPYYDNIFYTVLADFFYAWKRLLLAELDPKLFESVSTDSERELVASTRRHGTSDMAHERYCRELGRAIEEASRALKPDGIFSLVYSHSSLKGWEALVRAYRPADFRISSVQPLSIERRQRPRAMNSEAVNTCLVFVAHKGRSEKMGAASTDLDREFRLLCTNGFASSLKDAGWNDKDIAIALFAQGVALLANVLYVDGLGKVSDELLMLEAAVKEKYPKFSVGRRSSI
jgi:putative DNA methylase